MARITKTSKKTAKVPSQSKAIKATKAGKPSAIADSSEQFPEVRSLIDLLKKNGLAVLEFEKGDLRVTLKTPAGAATGLVAHAAPAAAPAPVAPAAATATPAPAETPKGNYKEITSPMVGTFYSSPSPDTPAFVEAGKTVNPETVVCIIEAMKVMNEIKAEIAGKVVEVVAENGKPVQFGQVLFRVS